MEGILKIDTRCSGKEAWKGPNMDKKQRGSQPNNKNGLVHGSYQSLDRVDGRTREAKILHEVEAALVTDLGGDPSAQEVILLQRVAVKSLRCFLSEREILKHTGDGQRRQRLEQDYISWSNSLRSDLALLGLERRAKSVMDLTTYIASQEAKQ